MLAVLAGFILAAPHSAGAAELDLATLTCDAYESQILPAAPGNPDADSIDTVMWLLGYAVAQSNKHVLYPDALAPFGFALDNECKSNPRETMLAALSVVKPETKNPMDLAAVECASFAPRHAEFARTDAESAKTITMWLFGFATRQAGSSRFDPAGRPAFESALLSECAANPNSTVLEALRGVKTIKGGKAASPPERIRRKPAGPATTVPATAPPTLASP